MPTASSSMQDNIKVNMGNKLRVLLKQSAFSEMPIIGGNIANIEGPTVTAGRNLAGIGGSPSQYLRRLLTAIGDPPLEPTRVSRESLLAMPPGFDRFFARRAYREQMSMDPEVANVKLPTQRDWNLLGQRLRERQLVANLRRSR